MRMRLEGVKKGLVPGGGLNLKIFSAVSAYLRPLRLGCSLPQRTPRYAEDAERKLLQFKTIP